MYRYSLKVEQNLLFGDGLEDYSRRLLSGGMLE